MTSRQEIYKRFIISPKRKGPLSSLPLSQFYLFGGERGCYGAGC